MKPFLSLLLLAVSLLTSNAQDPPPTSLDDDGSHVAVLGYHEFHPTSPPTQMRIQTPKFRRQMEALKNSNLPVLSLNQFLAWRRGEENSKIPPQSVLITIDDGWRSVYTEAFPILKELNLPFTLFLYKNYVGAERGSRALSLEMINEMLATGLCSLGSHSVSHHFPNTVKGNQKKGPDHYQSYLNTEFGESKKFLDSTFKINLTTYAYPGGFHTPEMYPIADALGYDHLFTVQPGKVRRDSPKHSLPRYIVLGNHDGAFEAALTFRNNSRLTVVPVELPYPTQPKPGSLVPSRLPTISINLSSIPDLDPTSPTMLVSGFGEVPATFDPQSHILSWTTTRPLRQPACHVSVHWKLSSENSPSIPTKWSFKIDHQAAYQANFENIPQ